MSRVEIYSTKLCAHCWRAKDLLDSQGISYTEIDASEPSKLEKMLTLTGGVQSVPQIFIDGHHIGGANELVALARNGELKKLFRLD